MIPIARKQLFGNLLLTLTALIWGMSFVAQSVGMDYVGPYTFNAARMFIGAQVLLPVIALTNQQAMARPRSAVAPGRRRQQQIQLLLGGVLGGLALFIALSLQQVGLVDSNPGKAGFITALYIVLVPLLGLLLKKPAGTLVWVSVGIAAVGLYLLCIKDGFTIGKGDFLVLVSSLFFASHILLVDHFSPHVDGVKFACMQFFVCGLVSLAPAFIWEQPSWSGLGAAWLPLGYAGILSSGVAYTFQIIAQRYTNPVVASLLMSLESVFAVLAAWLLLLQVLSLREGVGCLLVFCAIILAQLPVRKPVREKLRP